MKRQTLVMGAMAAVILAAMGCNGGTTPTAVTPTSTPASVLAESPTPAPTIAATATLTLPPSPTAAATLPPEVRIGVVYPLSGRLEQWGQEGSPFIDMAQADINSSPEAVAAGLHFSFVVRSSETTEEGALAAARDLVENEGVQVIVGLPTSGELTGAIGYLTEHHVAVVSSASTSPQPGLRQPDTVFRTAPPELYLARTLAELALNQGYRKAAVIYRTDGWGEYYAAEIAAKFQSQGYPTAQVSIVPTHPHVGDYAAEVAQLSARVAELGADDQMVVFMAVWEGEDLNILHHAAQDPTLSRVRWLAALLGPSVLTGTFPGPPAQDLPDARDFALAHNLWSVESHPPVNELLQRLWTQAKSELGEEPRFEHVYMYDALQIAARAVRAAGSTDGDAVAAVIPAAAQGYDAVTGVIRFDDNGDRASGDLAFHGLFPIDGGFEYRHFAYYDSATESFQLLAPPAPRPVEFCPEC